MKAFGPGEIWTPEWNPRTPDHRAEACNITSLSLFVPYSAGLVYLTIFVQYLVLSIYLLYYTYFKY